MSTLVETSEWTRKCLVETGQPGIFKGHQCLNNLNHRNTKYISLHKSLEMKLYNHVYDSFAIIHVSIFEGGEMYQHIFF